MQAHAIPLADTDEDKFAALPHGLRLCYRTYGQPKHPAVVLVAGLGLQLISWPLRLIEGLVRAGFYVVVFDNRDMGRSSHLTQPPPKRWQLLLRWVGKNHYQIRDMADDVAHLMDHLQLQQAHVVGMSMGGMIAQNVAAQHPQRVLSLTSIFSTTGNQRVGQPAGSTILRMLFNRPPVTLEQAQDKYVRMMRHIGNPKVAGIEQAWRHYIAQSWLRADLLQAQDGYERQIAAIVGAGDRSAQLYRIDTPTLVLHGDKDRIVHPSGGAATARSINGAHFHTIVGMRHQIDDTVVQAIVPLLTAHMQQATADTAAAPANLPSLAPAPMAPSTS